MTGAITAPLRFWDNKFWHHLVHRRLGETLFYYLVRIRPFDLAEVDRAFDKLFKEHPFGSIRVFPIFGTYDLLIRAWLYPSVADRFRNALDETLGAAGAIRSVHIFSVAEIEKRWHDRHDVNKELLATLDDETIAAVQQANQPEVFNELSAGNLVLTRGRSHNIIFFITINIESVEDAISLGVINGIKRYLMDNPNTITNVSIYSGFGFCQILVKGEVVNYFNIAPLSSWIGTAYRHHGVHTETYLVHGSTHLIGDETIGDATLLALKGKDLFVQSIIPEIYDKTFKNQERVVRILVDQAHQYNFTNKDRKLLHDYLLAFLNDDESDMAKAILLAFFGLESCLNKHHKQFISKLTGKTALDVYKAAHLGQDQLERPSLKNALQVCALAIKEADVDKQYEELTGGWDDLPKLRNDVMHGKVDVLSDWDDILRRLVPYLPRLRVLLKLIEDTIAASCSGAYF